MIDNDMLKEMTEAMRQADKKTQAYDSIAEVVRVEGDTAWVHLPGGVDETPVAMTVNAEPGDTVRVRVAGGQAWLTGSDTAPPTDDRTANTARAEAGAAQETADAALKDAARAAEAADIAEAAAVTASSAATQAVTQAQTATTAANNALTQLSTVEDVVGVLTWISEHGEYVVTTDTAVVPGKFYFTRSGSGTEADPYVYTVVADPTGDPSSAGYYELDGVDEAVSNYVGTHLALTDEGLFVTVDDSGYKLKITSSGVYIIDPGGSVVASYTSEVTLGDVNGMNYLKMSANGFAVTLDGGQTNTFAANLYNSGSTEMTYLVEPRVLHPNSGITLYLDPRITVGEDITMTLKMESSVETPRVIHTETVTFPAGTEYTCEMFEFEDLGRHCAWVIDYYGQNYINVYSTYPWDTHFSAGQGTPGTIVYKATLQRAVFFTLGERVGSPGGYSTVIGSGLTAAYDDQTVVGKYNDPKDKAFIVGNGSSGSSNESNALEVDWNGDVLASGEIEDGNGNVLSSKADASAVSDKVDMTEPYFELDTTAAAGTTDGDLYAAITALSWESEVIV